MALPAFRPIRYHLHGPVGRTNCALCWLQPFLLQVVIFCGIHRVTLVTESMGLPPAPVLIDREKGYGNMASSQEQANLASAAGTAISTPALEAIDIRKSLPLGHERIDILKGINLRIHKGEFVAIIGPSGSGKSTLLGIIAGLDNPTSGQVLVDGVDITRMGESQLAKVRNQKIGMVFQAFNLVPTLTAQEIGRAS